MTRLSFASTKNSDMRYEVGVEIPDPCFLLTIDEKKFIFLDHREFGVFLEHNKNPSIELVLVNPLMEAAQKIPGEAEAAAKLALHILRTYGAANMPLEVPTSFPLDIADFLRTQGVRLVPISPFVPQRLQKTKDEVIKIRESLQKTYEAFHAIEALLHEAVITGHVLRYRGELVTSAMLKRIAEEALFMQDMWDVEGIIVSCGAHAAIPHHPGDGIIAPNTTIVCDIFPRNRKTGYFADMTRTYVKGEPSPKLLQMYNAVRQAQEAATAAIRPGVACSEIHAKCVQVFRDLGYDVGERGFTHGTGHGLGLDIHEEPFLNASYNGVLRAGNVVTVEPGLYYPDLGGIRIEDVVHVTAHGCENLTNYPKEFVIL